MGETTEISWTDHTFSPWWGCQRVSPGCENCYAEAFSHRLGKELWGPTAPRQIAIESYWKQPLKWNRSAAKAGVRRRVFCASMADVFEDRRDLDEPRERLFKLIEETPALDWQLLTKRPENMVKLAPANWAEAWPANVWAGCTVEDQKRADERIPELLEVPSIVRFLSCEPLLGSVDLSLWLGQDYGWHRSVGPCKHGRDPWTRCDNESCVPLAVNGVTWVIVGGESGGGARPLDLVWARSLVEQCRAAGVAVFVKQLGAKAYDDAETIPVVIPYDSSAGGANAVCGGGAVRTGRPLKLRDRKGGDIAEFPAELQVREFPR